MASHLASSKIPTRRFHPEPGEAAEWLKIRDPMSSEFWVPSKDPSYNASSASAHIGVKNVRSNFGIERY